MEPDARAFFTCNRFLYDILSKGSATTLDKVARELRMQRGALRQRLLQYGLPTQTTSLSRLVSNIPAANLGPSPQVYVRFHEHLRAGEFFTEQELELFLPVAPWHFDHQFILLERFPSMTPERLKAITLDWFDRNPHDLSWSSRYFTDAATRGFRDRLAEYFDRLPSCIRELSNDEQFLANSDLSVAFLHGVVTFPVPGIASPHLHGQFLLGLRREGTGYLAVDSSRAACELGAEKWRHLLDWFKSNNSLYTDFTPLTYANLHMRLDSVHNPAAVVTAELPGGHHDLTNENNDVLILLKKPDGSSERRYVPLETALGLCFPILFPFGCPLIPAPTLRKKAQLLLAAHPFYRCGRLACHMSLYLYHVIQDSALRFVRRQISIQPVSLPDGVNRDIPGDLLFDDPSTPSYWSKRQNEVRAMCREYGDADLMITFTFVNKWPEVKETEDNLHEMFGFPLDLRFAPVETMMIWKHRFYDIKDGTFQSLIQSIGFGKVRHFVWRLEFQARGAPHVHSLIWLKHPLSLEQVQKHMFATAPDPQLSRLSPLVPGAMVHSCLLQRCQRGVPNAPCRYGFPKPVCRDAHLSSEGSVVLPRGSSDRFIVDYSPAFLLKWGGHCHIHVLRTVEHHEASLNAMHYIVKYNFKGEPSLRVQATSENQHEALFRARVVSSEEAVSRIFSFSYHGADTSFDFVSLKPPNLRQAAFVNGRQVQVTDVEKYFLRPRDLDQLPILAFFSLYQITTRNMTNHQVQADHELVLAQDEKLCACHNARPARSLIDRTWESTNLPMLLLIAGGPLFPATSLPNAAALQCALRDSPKIVLTDKLTFATDPNTVAYAWLLLNGCWRSDDEILAGQASWVDALTYHGLCRPSTLPIVQQTLVDYMLDSPRYSPSDIAVTLSRIEADFVPYLQTLRDRLPPLTQRNIDTVLQLLRDRSLIVSGEIPEELTLGSSARDFISCDFTPEELEEADRDLKQMVPQLNNDQRTVYNYVAETLTNGTLMTISVNGNAGTGKSFLIRALQCLFVTRGVPYITCASTGIAASLIRGRTVHSAFRIFTNTHGETLSSLTLATPAGRAIALCSVILIDEVTMTARDVLNCLDETLRKLSAQANSPHYTLPFGGKHVILFGDLAQVPAVVRTRDDFTESAEQFFASLQFASFTRFALTQIMRQNPDEHALLSLLTDVRTSHDRLSPSSLDSLRSRFLAGKIESVFHEVDRFVGNDAPEGMVVTFTNASADRYNDLILRSRVNASSQSLISFKALFFVSPAPSFRVPDRPSLTAIRSLQSQLTSAALASETEIRLFFGAFHKRLFNSIIPLRLTVCVGARVMLLQNLDIQSGLINGSRGTITAVLPDLPALEIRFDCQSQSDRPFLLTRHRSVEYTLSSGKSIFMFQFPIKPCWAVTAHKAQGQSLNRVAIDISDTAFAHGSLYVALSRVRTLDSILLFGTETFPESGPLYHINPYIHAEEDANVLNDI